MRRIGGIGIGLAILVAFGCGGGGSNVTTVPDPVVRFINASPGSVALDCFVDDTTVATRVPYLGSSADFQTLEARGYDVMITENSDLETQTLDFVSFEKDRSHILFAVGLVTPPNTELDKRLRLANVFFDRTRPNGDKARLILIHGYMRSAGNETPNVDFRSPGDNPLVNISNIEFARDRGFLVDAGPQTFELRRSGTESVITTTSFTFEAGKIYAAVFSGVEGATGAQAPKVTYIPIQVR